MDAQQPRQRRSSEPAQRAQYPSYPQYPVYSQQPAPQGQQAYGAGYQPSSGVNSRGSHRASRHQGNPNAPYRSGREGMWLLIVIVCIALLVAGGFM